MKRSYSMKKLSRGVTIALCAMLILGSPLPLKAADKLSPAFDIIAREHKVAANGIVGTEVYLSAEELSAAIGVSDIGKITIVSLPDPTLGRLQLGARYIEAGQTISQRNINAVKFVPFGNEEACAVFSFCRGDDPYGAAYTCSIYTTKTVNTAPTINTPASALASSGEVNAYSGIPHLGTLSATDRESDPLTFEIISQPANGKVKLTDRDYGYYEYTANEGFEGKDSFTVCVTDKYGNRSGVARVVMRVSAPEENEVFADMEGHWANGAAITCVRAGVLEAPAANTNLCPDEYISRAEFLSLAMTSAGYDGFSIEKTGFLDDGDIADKYKGCVAAAEALGIIDGAKAEGGMCFYPNNQITRSEAAVIVSRLTGITGDGTVSVFANSDLVPAFAADAMAGLHEAGILRGMGGGDIGAYAPITRGAAVQMMASIVGR